MVHVRNEQLAVQKLARVRRRVIGKQPLRYLRPIVGETIRGNNGISHRLPGEGGVAELGGGVVAARRGLGSDWGVLHAARAAIDKLTFCEPMKRLFHALGDRARRAWLRMGCCAHATNCPALARA